MSSVYTLNKKGELVYWITFFFLDFVQYSLIRKTIYISKVQIHFKNLCVSLGTKVGSNKNMQDLLNGQFEVFS